MKKLWAAALLCAGILAAQPQPADSQWPVYGHDPGGTKYSPLDQINRQNVGNLKVAWTYHTLDMYQGGSAGLRGRKSAFETTPVYVDGTLFASTAFGRVIALDPEKGTARWQFDPQSDIQAGSPPAGSCSWAPHSTPTSRPTTSIPASCFGKARCQRAPARRR